MDSERQPDCEVVYRAAIMAVEAGDRPSAVKLFRAALTRGLDGPHAIEACAICSAMLYDQHHDEEARVLGEQALLLDRTYLVENLDHNWLEGVLDGNPSNCEQLLVRLDNLWSQAADQLEAIDGPRAASDFLLSKLVLADHLSNKFFPGVYYRLGEYAETFGNRNDAKQFFRRVLDSNLTAVDDDAAHRHYVMLRAGAQLELDKLARSAKHDQSKCWVASALYGERSPEVRVLRAFRDSVLTQSIFGRILVDCYYRTGPHIAEAAKRFPIVGGVLRAFVVSPVVRLATLVCLTPRKKRGIDT